METKYWYYSFESWKQSHLLVFIANINEIQSVKKGLLTKMQMSNIQRTVSSLPNFADRFVQPVGFVSRLTAKRDISIDNHLFLIIITHIVGMPALAATSQSASSAKIKVIEDILIQSDSNVELQIISNDIVFYTAYGRCRSSR